jgi:4a-hydroxytetrahydrobiopterin dehydratase
MWQEENSSLYRKFEFADFKEAFAFMQKVAQAVEQANHHPKWQNEWNKVEIWLSSHDAGNKVTNKDYQLAATIDKIYKEFA